VGVQVFFVISGLVIANSAHGATPRQFLTSRFLRLYPAAWCAAAISFPLLVWQFPKMGDRLERLYFSLILFPGPFLATPYWTLPIELAFYFVVYTVVTFRGFRHAQWLAALLILWGVPWGFCSGMNAFGHTHWAWVDFEYLWGNMSLLRYGPYFGLGILIWLFKERRIRKLGLFLAGVAVCLAFIEIYTKTISVLPGFAVAPEANETPWKHLAATCSLVFVVAVVAILLAVKLNARFPRNAVLRRITRLLGLATYPFYLLHERVGDFAIYQANWAGLGHLASVIAALVSVGAIALLIARFCEPALRRLLQHIGHTLDPTPKEPALEAS
jgi:peptidoglycan/LPS O-acetylase OafA/YrhL